MLEYALIAALIAVVGIPAIGFLGTQTEKTFVEAGEAMKTGGVDDEGAVTPPGP